MATAAFDASTSTVQQFASHCGRETIRFIFCLLIGAAAHERERGSSGAANLYNMSRHIIGAKIRNESD